MRMMETMRAAAALWILAAWYMPAALAETTAAEIIDKSYEVNGGDDSISRLTFTFHKSDGSEKKLIYTMAWKKYAGEDDVSDKVIFFSEYPPDDNGKSYMIWMSANRDQQDDEWMYLPELRMVRKVTHNESHRHSDKEDDFAHSVLTQVNLVPRKPDLDNHSLIGKEKVGDHDDYVVESIPKKVNKNFPYQKIRRWITMRDFLCERIDYYGKSGEVTMRQIIRWKKIGDAWIWEQVIGENPKTMARTVLDISDIRINNGFQDDVFTARTLRLGKDSIAQ